jgi:hypothetical protein
LGKVKIGMKNEKGFPMSLDYFICDSTYKKYFLDAYGEKPSTIQIAFISNDFKDSCFERYECRDKDGRMVGYGDGEEMYLYNPKSKKYELTDDREAMKNAGKWEILLTLKFVIPKIRGLFGLFSFTTKGNKSSLPQIRQTFDYVLEHAGTVINIPFDLVVKKVKSQKPGEKSVFPVVSLVPNLSKDNMEILGRYLQQGHDIKQIGLIDDEKIKQLTA